MTRWHTVLSVTAHEEWLGFATCLIFSKWWAERHVTPFRFSGWKKE